MHSRERVEAVFQQQRPDKVPVYHVGFSSEVASALLGWEAFVGGGIQQWREAKALWQGESAHQEFLERSFQDAIGIARLCEHDIVRVRYWRYNKKPTKRIDENTFLYEYGSEENWRVLRYDPGSEQCQIFDYKPKARPSIDDLEQHVVAEERSVAEYRPQEQDFEFEIRAQRCLGHESIVRVDAVHLDIPAEAAWLEATILRTDLVARYLDVQVERAIRNVQFLAPLGFRHFFGGGDLASNDGPLYSPKTFAELVLPRLQRISAVCHRYGAYHLFASDGNLWPVADDLFGRSGVDGYYEIDRRAGMDLQRLRDRFPYLVLIGNISSQTVHMGSRAEVIAETLSCLEQAKRSSGIIVGVSNYLVPHTPVANVVAMLETIKRYR